MDELMKWKKKYFQTVFSKEKVVFSRETPLHNEIGGLFLCHFLQHSQKTEVIH